MAETVTGNPTEIRGEAKKEAFHQEAESKIVKFAFTRPDMAAVDGHKVHVKLAGTDSCRASVQILIKGGDNNLHYHPNMDLIYMVLQGQIEFYGPGDKLIGVFGQHEGLMLPENSRYWFRSIGEEEAHLLQIAGYPRGAKAAKRIPVEPVKPGMRRGTWIGMTEEELKIRAQNTRL